MTAHNKELSAIFHDIASMYRFLGGDNSFRAIAYQKASQAIRGLPEDISFYIREGSLEEIPGIGSSLAHDIIEFDHRGGIRRQEKLKKKVPVGLMPLMDIAGFGPQSLKKLSVKLHLRDAEDVIAALGDGRVAALKGFGPKKIGSMLRGLKLHKQVERRMNNWEALQTGERFVQLLRTFSGVKNVSMAGSVRRGKETVGDIDILAAVSESDRKKVAALFTGSDMAKTILAKGKTRASIIMKENGLQADLRMVNPSEWGSALQYFTGSREHNIRLRTIARDEGLKISEYGVFEIRKNRRVAGATEEEVYASLGMQYIPPEMREDRGEIQLAREKRIPHLVDTKDIRGDLQMHSTWSDGLMSLPEIVSFVRANFPYEYIAVTDHSKSERVAGGMDEKEFRKQIRVIRQINRDLGADFLKAGAEVDILADGALDLADDLLAELDWVTASVHSGLGRDNTARMIKACRNPFVNCIGHPTGRILGKREPCPLEVSDLIAAARETGTALEINAQPERMDMNDEFASEARKHGVMIVISTDSHKYTDFACMQLGVSIARRAWCSPGDILNCRPWQEVRRFVAKKRKLCGK